ncbi:Gfo/Idh/MocA family oxidoreductase, partial [bacterium]|nr:Gfo/Idh/MocA family oxidoreductase [bacterium]
LDRAKERAGGKGETCKDFRQVLGRKDIDAVVIGTPDHWHAIQTIDACDAGKDVYVEKPLSVTIKEGRRMVVAARRNQRVVQVGTHRRSSTLYHQMADYVRAGNIGKVSVGRAYRLSNMFPAGIGKMKLTDPPKELDWDLWLGPRPKQPYQANIAPYKFRWWHLYSSQVANWGVHYFDALRWLAGDLAPASLSAHGTHTVVDDDRTIPDTMEVIAEMPSGHLFIFGQYEASGNPAMATGRKELSAAEVELRGSQGTLCIRGERALVIPERGGQFQDRKPRMEPQTFTASGSHGDVTSLHARNFLDCVKSRQKPNADIEIGHRSTTFSLLANIALATKSRIEWDAEKEMAVNNPAANQLLHYTYRKPWVLK